LIVVASIHQPSTKTFNVFDQIYLLARGQMCYGGPREELAGYFESIGLEMPLQTNPAEWILELVDTDFAADKPSAMARLANITAAWKQRQGDGRDIVTTEKGHLELDSTPARTSFLQPWYILHRNFIKSYRDLVAYWVRVVMYLGEPSLLKISSFQLTYQAWQS
jgi:hypothetical protein